MLVPPVSALGLRLSDEEIRIAVGVRLGTTLYEPHLCHHCREKVDARGLHGLVCRGGSGKHQRHSMLNDVIWRALGRAKIPAHKEPLGLSREDGKRPDGVTLIPWTRGRCLAWDVTVSDTYTPRLILVIHLSELAKPPNGQLSPRGPNIPPSLPPMLLQRSP